MKNTYEAINKLKIRKKMDIIREKLKDLTHNFFRIESKEIRKNFCNIEKRNQFDSKRTNKYLDELDEKILDLNKYYCMSIKE